MRTKKEAVKTEENRIVVFQEKAIRRTWHNDEWWFSVVDVCGVLASSVDPGAYWRKLKQRLDTEGSEAVTFCHGLKLEAPDGKQRITDCANTGGSFPYHPIHSLAEGRTLQTLAGEGWVRACKRDRRSRAGKSSRPRTLRGQRLFAGLD